MSARRHVCGPTLAVAAIVLFGLAATVEPASSSPALSRPLNAFDAAVVERARSGAARRLESAECLKVLTDFRDRSGRTLAHNLETWNQSAADYIRMLPVRDASSTPFCKRQTIDLATIVGMLPIFVCPAGGRTLNSQFARVQADNPSRAEIMLIHEMLHTLGLGEDPPSTFEITDQVTRRCR